MGDDEESHGLLDDACSAPCMPSAVLLPTTTTEYYWRWIRRSQWRTLRTGLPVLMGFQTFKKNTSIVLLMKFLIAINYIAVEIP